MKKLTKEDISQEVFDLYDARKIDRRQFVEKYQFCGSCLHSKFYDTNYVGSMIKSDDPRLKSEFITYDSPKAEEKIKELFIATRTKRNFTRNNRGMKTAD
jgi:carboxymethylenebutenolidase